MIVELIIGIAVGYIPCECLFGFLKATSRFTDSWGLDVDNFGKRLYIALAWLSHCVPCSPPRRVLNRTSCRHGVLSHHQRDEATQDHYLELQDCSNPDRYCPVRCLDTKLLYK